LIVKLHGDYRLEPKNTNAQTAELETELARQVRVLLQDRGLIFMGYGGNDAGVVRVLDALPLAPAALPLGVYWLSPAKPNTAIADWLERRDAIWVKSDDFDEMMVLVKDRFTVPHPDEKRFERVFRNYMETYVSLSGRIASLPDTAAEAPALKAAASRIDESFTGWWAVELAARRVKEEDPEQADRIYRKGLKRFPNSPELLGNYVGFLLAAGRRDEGLPLLDRILGMLGLTGRTDLPAECWFYALAHRPAEQRREALANLKRVLVGGGRSRDWDLSRNIERARQDGHPDVEWLEKLAQVINGKADISVLDEWDKWRETEV
jgi:tetratricopeptide (TPR) repeat protein